MGEPCRISRARASPPVDRDRSRAGRDEPEDRADRRGLAGAVDPDQGAIEPSARIIAPAPPSSGALSPPVCPTTMAYGAPPLAAAGGFPSTPVVLPGVRRARQGRAGGAPGVYRGRARRVPAARPSDPPISPTPARNRRNRRARRSSVGAWRDPARACRGPTSAAGHGAGLRRAAMPEGVRRAILEE